MRNRFARVPDARAVLSPAWWFCGFCAAEKEDNAHGNSMKTILHKMPQLCKDDKIKTHFEGNIKGCARTRSPVSNPRPHARR